MNRRRTVIPLLVSAAIGLGACSGTTPGTASRATTDPLTPSMNGSSTSSSDASATLASTQPCDLLSGSELSQLGVGNHGTPDTGSGARTCSWQHPTDVSGTGYLVAADVRDHQGIKDINTDGVTVTDHSVGRHQGRLLKDTSGGDGCTVVIGVTDSSRVDVQANTNQATVDASCQLALRVAPLVEARLP